ncbi:unnamed protein product [Mycena citricolor]|uniref:DUF6534 domain-containing protein n=1 Tax=Mycena citricolor TaxID=2018698 RepID=A0AAD2Q3M9_9AGAR|nr:unnamed protein product [Mycena citricolor]
MAAPPAAPPAFPPLDDTLGAMEIGGVVGTFLFGIGTLQTFYYFRHFTNDSRYLRWTVAFLWHVMSTSRRPMAHMHPQVHGIGTYRVGLACALFAHGDLLRTASACSFAAAFSGDDHPLLSPDLLLGSGAWLALLPPQAVFTEVRQVFFANRIRVLSGKWFITVICWFLTLLRAICTFAMLGVTLHIATLSELEVHYQWLMAIALSLGVAVDVIVAGAMCWCLMTIRTDSITFTRQMVDTLILWTLEAGTATGGTSVAIIIFFFLRKDLAWFPFYLVLAKLFSNSMLASLNGRQRFRGANKPAITLESTVRSNAVTPNLASHRVTDFEMAHVSAPHGVEFASAKDLEATARKQMFE